LLRSLPQEDRAKFGIQSGRNVAGLIDSALEKELSLRPSTALSMIEWLTTPFRETVFTIFVSYRVATDSHLANILFEQLNNAYTPKGRRVLVYLDRYRLVDGEDWETGFSLGLHNSLIFLPLVSEGFTAPLAGLDSPNLIEPLTGRPRLQGQEEDPSDNVLRELQLAVAMIDHARARPDLIQLRKILPIFVGKIPFGCPMSNFFSDGSDGGGGRYPESVSPATTKSALEFLQVNYRLDLEHDAQSWTIKNIAERVMEQSGINLWENQGEMRRPGLAEEANSKILTVSVFHRTAHTVFLPVPNCS